MSSQPRRLGATVEPVELASLRADDPGVVKPSITLQQVGHNKSFYLYKLY